MRFVVNLLGTELLAVHFGKDEPAEHECAVPATFGFHGGSGGLAEATWQADADRPIDAG